MTVELVLTEEIIDCFHSCAKRADYRQLFNDHPKFFEVLVEKLEKVKFLNSGDVLFFTKNAKHFLDVLKKWHSGSISFCQELLDMEEEFPMFIGHLREFGSVKDWDEFYNSTNYMSIADDLFGIARKQEVLDFKIECAGLIFDSFEKRDRFLDHDQKLKNELSQMREKLGLIEEKGEEQTQILRSEFVSQMKEERDLSEEKLEENNQQLRNELYQLREELRLSEEKREEDGHKLKNELMERFESQAQQTEDRISETNEKIESMNRKLAHFNSSFNEKFDYLGELFSSTQLGEKTEGLNIQKKLAEIDDKFNEKWAKMTFRADWMDRTTERILTILTFIFIFVYIKFF